MNVTIENRPAILAIFALTYLALAIGRIPGLKLNRTGIALCGAIAMMILSGRTAEQVSSDINWATILLLFGFFVISAQLQLSGFYDRVAVGICERLSRPTHFLVFLIVVTAGLSAFLNNDIVCYALTPFVAAALLKRGINPVPFLIALAASSNVGAGLTLIGNAQNMMIGTVAGLGFARYLLWSIAPVAAGLASIYVVTRVGGRGDSPVTVTAAAESVQPAYPLDRYHATKGIVVLGAVIALFFTSIPREVTVLVAAAIHLLSTKFSTEDLLALVDWPILVLFGSLFVVSGAFGATGYGDDLVRWMQHIGFNPSSPTNEALLTTALTVLINNAPAVMLLIKVVPINHLTNAYVLVAANSFAGNAVLTASVANIIVVQQARRVGITISFGDFLRLGLPITLASLGGLIAWAAIVGS
jgi:Na+/H+ antiporter NhaD/arsenite permease-like protein